jgi:hypothetical protein
VTETIGPMTAQIDQQLAQDLSATRASPGRSLSTWSPRDSGCTWCVPMLAEATPSQRRAFELIGAPVSLTLT